MAWTYAELFRDRRWQRRRLEIFARDGWECRERGCVNRARNEIPLAVHHRWYVRGLNPWEYPDAALVTLCEECHSRRHRLAGEQFAFPFLAAA